MPSKNDLKLDRLIKCAGKDTFLLLCEEFPGDSIRFPKKGMDYCEERRNEDIIRDFYNNVDMPIIVDKYRLTSGQIMKIVNAHIRKRAAQL